MLQDQLTEVSPWLVTLAPDHALTFVDHALIVDHAHEAIIENRERERRVFRR
jgi:hypothetical protein